MSENLYAFGGQFFKGVEALDRYHIYSFEHLDDLSFMQKAHEALSAFPDADDYISAICSRFSQCGWEGDGELQLFWLPPFVTNSSESHGTFCFHVKQSNNGTCWIASPKPLGFNGLNYVMEEVYP